MGTFVIKKVTMGIKYDLKATNGIIIGTSNVMTSKSVCEQNIACVKRDAPAAVIDDQTKQRFVVQENPKFLLFTDHRGETRFTLCSVNGDNILTSREGYKSKAAAINGIESVKRNAVDAEIVSMV